MSHPSGNRKARDEEKLIMPKHMAEIPYFYYSLKVYHDNSSGLSYADKPNGVLGFKSLLKKELHDAGVEVTPSSDDTHYTKCAQLPRYFGFVRYVGPNSRTGDAAITERGEKMYAALASSPQDFQTIYKLFFESIVRMKFGRLNEGVGSDSCYEPLALFFKVAKDLGGVTAKEFGYLIQRLDTDFCSYSAALEELIGFKARVVAPPVNPKTQASNITDWTAIKLLIYIGFLDEDKLTGRVSLKQSLVPQFALQLEHLAICNKGYMSWMYGAWLRKVKGKDDQTAGNYRKSLGAMSKDIGRKDSAIFEGFFKTLTGEMPAKQVYEVKSLAEYDNVFARLNKFFNMPQTKDPGDFDWAGYDECYYYTKAPQNIDNRRLYNACKCYREFLGWWDTNKSNFKITETEDSMYKGKLGEIQKIVYGAPGTGKSFDTDNDLVDAGGNPKARVFRTTFHPDSDYSTFVGAYKPTMKPVERIVQVGQDLKKPNFEAGIPNELKVEEKITYEFRPQAFMNAYVAAWKDVAKPVVLIIEEINRGNCAQIFGDLFQLLDRDDKSGYSMYPITADTDLKKWLAEAEQFGTGLAGIAKPERIKQQDWDQILKGEMLALPPNLYIWATMNTSDQSLFPIDSAFKRRWDWKYVPIREGKLKNGQKMNWKIKFTIPAHQEGEQQVAAKDYIYDWWDFLKCVNALIFKTTDSEDKKLGYFFVKPDCKSKPELDDNDLISADRFVGKVIFYLWNDVFKDYGIETIFKAADADKKPEDEAKGVEFQAFFNEDDDHANVNTLLAFFKHLKLKSEEEKEEEKKAAAANAQNNPGAAQGNPPAQGGNANPET